MIRRPPRSTLFPYTTLQESHMKLLREHQDKYPDPDVLEMAWASADNLVEQEIAKSAKSDYSKSILQDFDTRRKKRNEWVKSQLERQGGNIASKITPDRVFGTLSEGEKRRILVAMADVASRVGERVAIILDEPLANLDEKNKALQIKALKRIQEEHAVALIIISHDIISALK